MLHFEDFVVGREKGIGSIPVGEGELLAFARRFDAQDFHTDPQAAKASFVGRLIASGWHSCSLLMRLLAQNLLLESSAMGAPGIDEVKWLRPVEAGDVLSARYTVVETRSSRSRPEMGLVRLRFTLENQHAQAVLEQVNWIMFGKHGSGIAPPPGDWLAHATAYVAPDETSPLIPPATPTAPAAFFEDIAIGQSVELGSFVFTAPEIVAFARSFDPQPFHMDEAAARHSLFGRLAASGWHTASVWMALTVEHRKRQVAACAPAAAPRLGPSPGFSELRWTKPVFAGDRITYHSRVTHTRASASRPQWGLFFHHNIGVNQHGDEVFCFDGCAFVERRTV